MMHKFQNEVIIAALMLCLGLYISFPVSGYSASEEAVYLTINQADQEETGTITIASDDGNESAIIAIRS